MRLLAKPELSRFYGIRITMNFVDHAPPHFHAMYGKEVFYADARIAKKPMRQNSGVVVRSSLPFA